MSHFWATASAYPAPRRRAVAPPGAAPVEGGPGGFAIGSGDSRPFRAVNWTWFLEFSAAGHGRAVSPQIRGPALLKQLVTGPRAIIGNTTVTRLLISPAGGGATVTSASTVPALVPGDRVVFDSSYHTVASVAAIGGLVEQGTGAAYPLLLDHLVEDDQFFVAVEVDNTQAGTISVVGYVLIYEQVRLDQLALLVG
jgi:hypothetical protein